MPKELHPGGEVTLDGSDLSKVSFVGQIRDISKQTTNTTFERDDGTGTVDAKDWAMSAAGACTVDLGNLA